MIYTVTEKHPELKKGLLINLATNPKGMYIADAHWVMTKKGDIYYEEGKLHEHIKKGYLEKVIEIIK